MIAIEEIDKLFINFLQKNDIRQYVFNILKHDEERLEADTTYTVFPMLDYKNVFDDLASIEQRYNGNNFLISFQEKWYNEYFTFFRKYRVCRLLKEEIKSYRYFRHEFYRINSQKYFFYFFNAAISREHIKKILGVKNIVL